MLYAKVIEKYETTKRIDEKESSFLTISSPIYIYKRPILAHTESNDITYFNSLKAKTHNYLTIISCVRTHMFDIHQESVCYMIFVIKMLGQKQKSNYLCIIKRLIDCLG